MNEIIKAIRTFKGSTFANRDDALRRLGYLLEKHLDAIETALTPQEVDMNYIDDLADSIAKNINKGMSYKTAVTMAITEHT